MFCVCVCGRRESSCDGEREWDSECQWGEGKKHAQHAYTRLDQFAHLLLFQWECLFVCRRRLRSRSRVTGRLIRNRSAAWEMSWKPKKNSSLICKSTIHTFQLNLKQLDKHIDWQTIQAKTAQANIKLTQTLQSWTFYSNIGVILL